MVISLVTSTSTGLLVGGLRSDIGRAGSGVDIVVVALDPAPRLPPVGNRQGGWKARTLPYSRCALAFALHGISRWLESACSEGGGQAKPSSSRRSMVRWFSPHALMCRDLRPGFRSARIPTSRALVVSG